MSYLWVKAFHIVFVIYWMAGLFMLPRYLAYHAEAPQGSDEALRWCDREAKITKIILNPAMMVSWVLGLYLAWQIDAFTQGWWHAKMLLVVGMTLLQVQLGRWRREFAAGGNPGGSTFFRLVNEIPTLAAIAIVLLVVLKPFQ